MRRREFLPILGAAAAWPMALRAERSDMPVIGFLRSTPAAPFTHIVATFREGLKEQGFVEGTSVAIEYRFADNRPERLPGLAAELVRRQVAVIVGNSQAAEAAKIHEWSNEVAILIETEESLEPTEAASAVEDPEYVRIWV